ncbi:MAG: hypothetical protein AAFU53_05015 [Cyanobacteria bacterium J06632_3]
MVKASGQIEKDLAQLVQRTQDMSEVLEPLYDGYLKALGEASKRQLMSAVFHLCTQSYADRFLSLSWQQRNDLQKELQVLSAQIYVQLCEQREETKKKARKPQRNDGLAFLQRLLESRSVGTIVHSGSRDELREKLAAIARSESASIRAENPDDREPSDADNESDVEDWDADVPSAEDIDSFIISRRDLSSRRANSQKGQEHRSDGIHDGTDDDTDADGLPDAAEFDTVELDPDEMSRSLDSSAADFRDSSRERPDDADVDLAAARAAFNAEDDGMGFGVDMPAADQRLSLSDEEDLLAALEGLARRSSRADDDADEEEQPLTPVHLVKQQVLLEKAIRDVFKTVSEAANDLLQKADVMPNFPKALMAAATDSRGLGEPVNSVPNVVKVSVRVMHGEANLEFDDSDAEDEKERRRSRNKKDKRRPGKDRRSESSAPRFVPREIMEIEALPEFAVVNLQLSEVEFSDPTVSVWRNRVRKELSKLKQLGMRYKKTQRSLETAQAEDAWRSSWTGIDESAS